MAVTNYSGYNPDPYNGQLYGASWTTENGNIAGWNPTVGSYTQTTTQAPSATGEASPLGGTPAPPPPPTNQTPTEDPYTKYLREERERIERLRTMNARAIMEAQMAAYGLGGLSAQIVSWITEGYESDAIMALVRQSSEYATRFPAMKALQAKGQAISESEYIAYEQTMTQYERLYGLPTGMLSSKDMVTKNLTNGLSAREVDERAVRASASIYSLPPEFRDTMQRYYGIDSGGLTAYFLDPDVASPLLEKQYVSAQIGMEASKRQIDVGALLAEQLYAGGVDRDKAATGFEKVADQAGLTVGKGDALTQSTLIGANLGEDVTAKQAVERVASGRVGRFAGGGSFVSSSKGVGGLGSSGA